MALGPWRRGKQAPTARGIGAGRMVPGRGEPGTSRLMGSVHWAHDTRMTFLGGVSPTAGDNQQIT
jgi:hypothetical protein